MTYDANEEDAVLRIFKIAKGCGCRFYLGSDAHDVKTLEVSLEIFDRAIGKIGLEEKDKYIIE